MTFRVERDYLGEKKVPLAAYYGIHTQRAKESFNIIGHPLPLQIIYALAEVKIAAAHANIELNLLEQKKGNAIIKAAKEILIGNYDKEFVVDAFQAGAGTPTHMNVNEVIANIAIELLGESKGNYSIVHPNDDVNMGQSSNNVFPTAIKIATYKQLELLLHSLISLRNNLMKKSEEFKSILKSSRTHLQDAVPITLGQEFHAYATSIKENILRIKALYRNLKILNIGKNAVGTGINTYPDFTKKILKHLQKINNIQWEEAKDTIYFTQNITLFLETSSTLRMLAVDLLKQANDLMLLSSGPNTGLREINLPPVEPGSSIMPGKVNPSIVEMLSMVCFQVIGNDHAISLCTQRGHLDMNVMTPLIAKNLIESTSILIKSIETFTDKCVKKITANDNICKYYFEHSAGLATLLNPYIGYDKASEVVQESLKTGESIFEVISKKKLLKKEELDRILDYRKVTQPNLTKEK